MGRSPFALGSLDSTAAVRIPGVLAAYHQRYPQVQLDLSIGPSGDMIDGIPRRRELTKLTAALTREGSRPR